MEHATKGVTKEMTVIVARDHHTDSGHRMLPNPSGHDAVASRTKVAAMRARRTFSSRPITIIAWERTPFRLSCRPDAEPLSEQSRVAHPGLTALPLMVTRVRHSRGA